ncbi:hypothetical protein J2S43_000939 [Catenuloplanes nepalensis]|uniref:Uncharacterized protein n=1 Tax=Catenuloplanes nepalensis TaxID=587533 RepID=A0ABT9MLY2_9ACTN|nr:hypothetical protein [Catenuloplanes nepalensis]MDP9792427.1 hypothetical protein [Catenuloplanes nepalensis]
MSSLARVLAAGSKTPQRVTLYRHLHVSEQPIVMVPIILAGETNAPLAVMVGSDPGRPEVIVTRQPRERAERLRFAERLAGHLLYPIASMAATTQRVDTRRLELSVRAIQAPQVWVPNSAGIDYVRLLGRMTRFRSSEGPWAVAPSVRQLGIWLTWLAEQAEFADSCVLVPATRALSAVWATGQSDVEDGNLAAVMAWLAPPPGMAIIDAARRAEDPAVCPPAGPATDPTFDRLFLQPTLRDLASAAAEPARRQVLNRLTGMLVEQMRPTWDLVWQAIDLLRAEPPAARVARRWERQRDRFTAFHHYVTNGGYPQAKRDNAVRGAQRLAEMEQRLASFDAERAYDDPLVLADYRLAGEAFSGEVVASDPHRRVRGAQRFVTRPLVTVTTTDPVRLDVGQQVHDPSRNGQRALITRLDETADGWIVELELQDKMGRGRVPEPGSVPVVGDDVVYTAPADTFVRRGRAWPARENIPWTHGGPPPEPVPVPEDAVEDWS